MTGARGSQGAPGFAVPLRLHLLPLQPEPPAAELLRWLGEALASRLGVEVTVADASPAADEWLSAERSQLSSNAIVDSLIERYPLSAAGGAQEWVLALTAADLTGGSRPFVFGEAAMGGAWAVVSVARFGAPGEPRFRERLLKEALHELGHLAGLGHCSEPHCLMTASATVAQVDARGIEPCARCRSDSAQNGT